jgi:hypothetical protein
LSGQERKSTELREAATKNLDILVGSEDCLAFKEKTDVENKPMDLSLHSLIDFRKLKDYATRFSDFEPDCARDYKFGYRVRVETLPIDISSESAKWGSEGVFGKILELIDGKKTTFVLDSSGSMKEMAGPKSKMDCLKDFMNGFVDSLSAGSGIAIFVYGTGNCGIEDVTNGLVILDGNRNFLKNKINGLYPQDATPLGEALETGFIFSKQNGIDTIVLLTDGCQWDCAKDDVNYPVDIAQKYMNEGITVYTIGFGLTACLDPLKKIAQMTGGEFFDARLCEELVAPKPKERLNVNIPVQSWEFGSSVFSKDESLKEMLTISVPVNVYFDESKILPAKMVITIVDGELERLVNAVEKVCSTNKTENFSLFFSYPTYSVGDKICMDFPSGKGCQKISCGLPLEFFSISPGNYVITIQPSTNSIKVVT